MSVGLFKMFGDIGKTVEEALLSVFPELEAMAEKQDKKVLTFVMDIVEQEVNREKRRLGRADEGNIFQFIKWEVDIVDAINRYIEVVPSEDSDCKKAVCPFHNDPDKNLSMTISPSSGIFYCFTCHKNGDVTTFTAMHKNFTLREAANFLVKRYELKVPEEYKSQLEKPA